MPILGTLAALRDWPYLAKAGAKPTS